jgi:hypothetical protein
MSQLQPTIEVPANVDVPEIPSQYWGTHTGMILAIAFLIRSIAMLINSLTLFKKTKPEKKRLLNSDR